MMSPGVRNGLNAPHADSRFFSYSHIADGELCGFVWSVGLGRLVEFHAPPPAGMDLHEAAALARRGRLVVRVDRDCLAVDRWQQ